MVMAAAIREEIPRLDGKFRFLERHHSNSLELKLHKRRIGEFVYIREGPDPINVFNTTEIFIFFNKDYDCGIGAKNGTGYAYGAGAGFGAKNGTGQGGGAACDFEYGAGYGYGIGNGAGYGIGHGFARGSGNLKGAGVGYRIGNPER